MQIRKPHLLANTGNCLPLNICNCFRLNTGNCLPLGLSLHYRTHICSVKRVYFYLCATKLLIRAPAFTSKCHAMHCAAVFLVAPTSIIVSPALPSPRSASVPVCLPSGDTCTLLPDSTYSSDCIMATVPDRLVDSSVAGTRLRNNRVSVHRDNCNHGTFKFMNLKVALRIFTMQSVPHREHRLPNTKTSKLILFRK